MNKAGWFALGFFIVAPALVVGMSCIRMAGLITQMEEGMDEFTNYSDDDDIIM